MTETKIETNCDFCGSENKKFIKIRKRFSDLEMSRLFARFTSANIPASRKRQNYPANIMLMTKRKKSKVGRRAIVKLQNISSNEIERIAPAKRKTARCRLRLRFFSASSAKNDGWQVFGTDLSECRRRICARKPTKSARCLFAQILSDEKFSASKKFDVLNLTNVLEHVPSPTETLKDCRKFLNDEGIIADSRSEYGFLQSHQTFYAAFKTHRDLAKGGEFSLSRIAAAASFDRILLRQTLCVSISKKPDLKTVEIKPSKLSARAKENFL